MRVIAYRNTGQGGRQEFKKLPMCQKGRKLGSYETYLLTGEAVNLTCYFYIKFDTHLVERGLFLVLLELMNEESKKVLGKK